MMVCMLWFWYIAVMGDVYNLMFWWLYTQTGFKTQASEITVVGPDSRGYRWSKGEKKYFGTKVYLLSVVLEELCAWYKSEHFTYNINSLNLPNSLLSSYSSYPYSTGKEMEAQRVHVIQLTHERAWMWIQAAWLQTRGA